jgi:UDP-N-acetylglucosamine 4-epimerase
MFLVPGQNPAGAYAAVIPLFVKAVLNNEPPVINGDGQHSRDFTFVENAVQANVLALLQKEKRLLTRCTILLLAPRFP